MMVVISDTGPLIYLASTGHLSLLKERFGHILVPEEVYREICVQGKGKPGAEKIEKTDWIERREIEDNFLLDVLRLELDKGESEVIALAKQLEDNREKYEEKGESLIDEDPSLLSVYLEFLVGSEDEYGTLSQSSSSRALRM